MNAPDIHHAPDATAGATSPSALRYQSGFGNQFETEAVPGALPQGRNSPQRAPMDLYPELLSGSAFTAPRVENRRTWLYRRQPSVVTGAFHAYEQPYWTSGAAGGVAAPPDPLRWHPFPMADESRPVDFVDSLKTLVSNGDPDAQTGMASLVYAFNRPMTRRALMNADGEMLLVPQQGGLRVTTEMGQLDVVPGEIALIPRGVTFRVDAHDGAARGYVCENYGAAFRLPELGPIGSNGLANPRDFLAPVAAHEPDGAPYEVIRKTGGALWRNEQAVTPFNVVAWHGNLTPLKYDTKHFMTIGSISFDHPDPSIFTVLTSPSDTPGTANCDFVIFPPRWLVQEDTFRPPWYHRNVMSEFMGLIYGQYDAKPEGFRPGGASLHNCLVPHGPDADAFEAASSRALTPQKLDHTLAFMFESRWRFRPSEWALRGGALDTNYAACWGALKDKFKPA
ncbi:MAG: homogentisate 1,2-dioxygenase [Mitsuaria chitosanitabida]|uniref:homogentisate 1,2-dioxygenase n=1 Tax=Roseateles chitosanitabidus TaxID=65048 RepID=UPI001B0EA576|nr:homogentisate 1,2-dioxygenase [Roseateles chitosanitabidus]MBO9688158.1 homogentisate 1,2-dioxygenase [Roseateles chitosanitabidus]